MHMIDKISVTKKKKDVARRKQVSYISYLKLVEVEI